MNSVLILRASLASGKDLTMVRDTDAKPLEFAQAQEYLEGFTEGPREHLYI